MEKIEEDPPPFAITSTSVIDVVPSTLEKVELRRPGGSMWNPRECDWDKDDEEYGLVSVASAVEAGHWYVNVANRVYGIDIDESPTAAWRAPPSGGASADKYIRYGLHANIIIRNQICYIGMVIMSISTTLLMLCILITCCSNSNSRMLINESLREPLLRLDEIDRRINNGDMLSPTRVASPPPPPQIADGEIVHEKKNSDDRSGAPLNNPANLTMSYV